MCDQVALYAVEEIGETTVELGTEQSADEFIQSISDRTQRNSERV
jgi:hypothetical protein